MCLCLIKYIHINKDVYLKCVYTKEWTSLMAQVVRSLSAVLERWVWSLGWDDPQEKATTQYGILAWEIPWTEEPGRLQVHAVTKSGTWMSNFTSSSIKKNKINDKTKFMWIKSTCLPKTCILREHLQKNYVKPIRLFTCGRREEMGYKNIMEW